MSLNYIQTLSGTGTNQQFSEVFLTSTHLYVGSPRYNNYDGLVTVYDLSDLTTVEATISSPVSSSRFGTSIYVYGDILVSSTSVYNNSAGIVVVYKKSGGTWSHYQTINGPYGSGTSFGTSIALYGSYLVVGSPTLEANMGIVNVYKDNGTSYSSQATLTGTSTGTYFGYTAGFIDDSTLLVGAPYESTDTGVVRVYTRSSETWTQDTVLTGESNSMMGYSMAIYNNTAVFGARNLGGAYLYTVSGGTWSSATVLEPTDADKLNYPATGSSVAIYGNYVLIGNNNFSSTGGAFLFYKNGSTWSYIQRYDSQDPESNGRYGYQLALNADYAAVGAWLEDSQTGNVYIYETVAMSLGAGDPHVKPIIGSRYYLPHDDETFMMYSNGSQDYPVTIKAKCWFLPKEKYIHKIDKLSHNGYLQRALKYSKLFENATYFKYVEIVCGRENVIIDMDNLQLCSFTSLNDVEQHTLPYIKRYENNCNILVSKIKKMPVNIYGKQANYGTYERIVILRTEHRSIKLHIMRDTRDMITRNGLKLGITKLHDTDHGSLVRKYVEYTSFGTNYNDCQTAYIKPYFYNTTFPRFIIYE